MSTTYACRVATSSGIGSAAEDRLRQIQSITDTALSLMTSEDLLNELLERLREILDVDTAVVLLVDSSRTRLVATAAKGLEEEVRQRVVVPVGQGFAGRVAAERKPVQLQTVDSAHVVNPLLVQRGLHSLLGVPLVAEGELVGVLHVGKFNSRHFTDHEIALLQLAADRAAQAARSLSTGAERAAAGALQQSLVPTALPEIPGVEMAARYSPGASTVGGDWYDVFTLPSGELGVVMGDVAGHGLNAAVVMGRMRSALRAYALETSDPAAVLDKLDRKMQHFEPGAIATVAYAVCHPQLEWAKIASAGHWPPVLSVPDGPSDTVDLRSGVLIGIDPEPRRDVVTVEIPAGAVLCFYTDGLIERRDVPIDTNLRRLCEAVVPGPPERVCAEVMLSLIGREIVADDVALLTLRRRDSQPPTT
ncbi:cyclic diguanylate phosphodiesterase [Actinoallomurus iriomotensis]|uniref:Cyclic diguanylate phosphodiesterase n=1 Tax=Actinoallomurus iriomotensis TaxID=478107 RepID=A0A9W6S3E4_9ACTN|nr:cyclic diguanylate phosphodiesterase [Actinoallomurus iriomotensis]